MYKRNVLYCRFNETQMILFEIQKEKKCNSGIIFVRLLYFKEILEQLFYDFFNLYYDI